MSNIVIPVDHHGQLSPTVGITLRALAARDRQLSRALTNLERNTLMRAASVRGHAVVQSEKLQEVDRLAREAMAGQAMLSHWAATLAQGDAFLADELRFFADIARMGKGAIIADTVADFGAEGRR